MSATTEKPLNIENAFWRNGVIWARARVNGQLIRQSLRTDNPKVAKKRVEKFLADLEQHRGNPLGIEASKDHGWPEAVDRWFATACKNLRPATVERYEGSIRIMHHWFGGYMVRKITKPVIAKFVEDRMRQGASAATVRRDLSVASLVMQSASLAGWVDFDPIPDHKKALVERREAIEPIPLRRMALVFRHTPPGLADLMRFAAKTGCRQEEAGSLERRHVNFNRNTILFLKTKTRSPRVIDMTPSVRRMMLRLLPEGGHAEQPVFRNGKGERYQSIPSQFRNYRDAAGVAHFRFHDMRHTFAIRWLQDGGDIYKLAQHLGHSSVTTTEHYSKWMRRMQEEVGRVAKPEEVSRRRPAIRDTARRAA